MDVKFRIVQTGGYPYDETLVGWEDVGPVLEAIQLDELAPGDTITITRLA